RTRGRWCSICRARRSPTPPGCAGCCASRTVCASRRSRCASASGPAAASSVPWPSPATTGWLTCTPRPEPRGDKGGLRDVRYVMCDDERTQNDLRIVAKRHRLIPHRKSHIPHPEGRPPHLLHRQRAGGAVPLVVGTPVRAERADLHRVRAGGGGGGP